MLARGVILAGAATLLVLASAAHAATLTVGNGKTYATITEAVEAASDGDKIVVFRGRYAETVIVAGRANLTLFAKRGAEWRPGTFDEGCLVLSQGADGASVQGFTFRTTGLAISLEGVNGVTVRSCRFRGADLAVHGVGDDLLVSRCDVRRGSGGLEVTGSRVVVERTTVLAMNDRGIQVFGDDAVITKNTLSKMADHSGIDVEGDRASVTRNRVRGAQIHGIEITGDDAVVSRNTMVINQQDGVHVEGDRALVERNVLRSQSDDGIQVVGEGFEVRSNRIFDIVDGSGAIHVENLEGGAVGRLTDNVVIGSTSTGIRIEGVDVQSSGNRVSECAELGFRVFGSGHVLSGDSVRGVGLHGFRIHADDTELVRCSARECGADGFRVEGDDVTLTGCTARDCDADGLHNAAVSTTTFTGCRLSKNTQDVAADAAGTLVDGGGNRFESGGVDALPVD